MGRLSDFQSTRTSGMSQEEELKQKYDSLKDMNKDQLNSELMREVARQKSSGSFDYNTLSNMVESLRGSLPQSDYENIKRILESLR